MFYFGTAETLSPTVMRTSDLSELMHDICFDKLTWKTEERSHANFAKKLINTRKTAQLI